MEINGVKIQFLGHSGFLITCKEGKRIVIDPYNLSNNVDKADLILITHNHYDHCSIKDIEKIKKPGTIIIIPPDAQSKITKIKDIHMEIVEIDDEFEFSKIRIKAVPSYTISKKAHPKSEGWLGFLIKIDGNNIIYHAGDTDNIPEMKNLTGHGKHGNHFTALLPVSGIYVMDAEEAVEVASFLSPDLCIPMHYGAGIAGTIEDAERFVKLCKGLGLNAVILEKI